MDSLILSKLFVIWHKLLTYIAAHRPAYRESSDNVRAVLAKNEQFPDEHTLFVMFWGTCQHTGSCQCGENALELQQQYGITFFFLLVRALPHLYRSEMNMPKITTLLPQVPSFDRSINGLNLLTRESNPINSFTETPCDALCSFFVHIIYCIFIHAHTECRRRSYIFEKVEYI